MRNFLFRIGDAEMKNGKWAAVIDSYATRPNGEVSHKSSRITSAAIFESEVAAIEGADRALVHLEATGEFPNLCEPF